MGELRGSSLADGPSREINTERKGGQGRIIKEGRDVKEE